MKREELPEKALELPTMEWCHHEHPFEDYGKRVPPLEYCLTEEDRDLIGQCVPTSDVNNRKDLVETLRVVMLAKMTTAEVRKLTWSEIIGCLKASQMVKLEATPPTQPEATHSEDFTTVNWYGEEYDFDHGNQSNAVGVLWGEWMQTGMGLHQDTIAKKIDHEGDRNFRLDKTFKDHPALNTMIRKVGKGKYKLTPPEKESEKVSDFPETPR